MAVTTKEKSPSKVTLHPVERKPRQNSERVLIKLGELLALRKEIGVKQFILKSTEEDLYEKGPLNGTQRTNLNVGRRSDDVL